MANRVEFTQLSAPVPQSIVDRINKIAPTHRHRLFLFALLSHLLATRYKRDNLTRTHLMTLSDAIGVPMTADTLVRLIDRAVEDKLISRRGGRGPRGVQFAVHSEAPTFGVTHTVYPEPITQTPDTREEEPPMPSNRNDYQQALSEIRTWLAIANAPLPENTAKGVLTDVIIRASKALGPDLVITILTEVEEEVKVG